MKLVTTINQQKPEPGIKLKRKVRQLVKYLFFFRKFSKSYNAVEKSKGRPVGIRTASFYQKYHIKKTKAGLLF